MFDARDAMSTEWTHRTQRTTAHAHGRTQIHDGLRVRRNAFPGRALCGVRPELAFDRRLARKSFDTEVAPKNTLHVPIENRMVLTAREREDGTRRRTSDARKFLHR